MTPPELTEAEWALIKAVWDLEPCPAPTVQEYLAQSRNWTYSTVRTLLDRMVGKGLLSAEKLRHLTMYRAVITREQAQLGEVRYALKNAFDGALTPMVQRLLDAEKITPAQLDELEALIAAKRKAARNSKAGH
jgi:BlaI family penicillinase repressor